MCRRTRWAPRRCATIARNIESSGIYTAPPRRRAQSTCDGHWQLSVDDHVPPFSSQDLRSHAANCKERLDAVFLDDDLAATAFSADTQVGQSAVGNEWINRRSGDLELFRSLPHTAMEPFLQVTEYSGASLKLSPANPSRPELAARTDGPPHSRISSTLSNRPPDLQHQDSGGTRSLAPSWK